MQFRDFTTRDERLIAPFEATKHARVRNYLKVIFQVLATIVVLWALVSLYFLTFSH